MKVGWLSVLPPSSFLLLAEWLQPHLQAPAPLSLQQASKKRGVPSLVFLAMTQAGQYCFVVGLVSKEEVTFCFSETVNKTVSSDSETLAN